MKRNQSLLNSEKIFWMYYINVRRKTDKNEKKEKIFMMRLKRLKTKRRIRYIDFRMKIEVLMIKIYQFKKASQIA